MLKPLENFLELILKYYLSFTNPIFSLILLSLTVYVILLPLYKLSDLIASKDKNKKKEMEEDLEKISKIKNKQEKYFYTKRIYKRNNYHPIHSLSSLIGLLIQIPFFIVAYNMLKHFEGFNEMSAFIFKDLSKADALFKLENIRINLMPFVMTIITSLLQ